MFHSRLSYSRGLLARAGKPTLFLLLPIFLVSWLFFSQQATQAANLAAPLLTGRTAHTDTILPDGDVLIVGGYSNFGNNGYDTLATAERYDFATGQWQDAGTLSAPAFLHTMTLLQDGRVLVAGGENGVRIAARIAADTAPQAVNAHEYYDTVHIYDPTTNTWETAAPLNSTRSDHSAILLPDGRVLVAGGIGAGGLETSAEIYDPVMNQWSLMAGVEVPTFNSLTLLTDGRVLLIDKAGTIAKLFDPESNIWSNTDVAPPNTVTGHRTVLLPDGRVLLIQGSVDTLLYDSAAPIADRWQAVAGVNGGISGLTLLPDGQVAVSGGYQDLSGMPTQAVQAYDPAADEWQLRGSMDVYRQFHSSTLLLDGQLLFAGGEYDVDSYTNTTELFNLWPEIGQRPVLDPIPPFPRGGKLTITGSGFADSPLVQIRSLHNGQTSWLSPDPNTPPTDTSFTSAPFAGVIEGYAMVTVFVNGTPSISQIVQVEPSLYRFVLDNQTLPEETTAAGTLVGTFSEQIADAQLMYTLLDDADGAFTLTPSGELKTAIGFFNYEQRNKYTITAQGTGALGTTVSNFTIHILDQAEPPTGVTLSRSILHENETAIGTLTGVDEDFSNNHSFALVNGAADNAQFVINGNVLSAMAPLNYEADKRYYNVEVRVIDAAADGNATDTLLITLTDKPETPTDITLSSNTIGENQAANTPVGSLMTSDEDSGNFFTYTLVTGAGATNNDRFRLSGSTLQATERFNYEAQNSYSVRVRSTDNTGRSVEKALTINVTDRNDPPTAIYVNPQMLTIAENKPANSLIGAFSTSDGDFSDSFEYALVSGAGSSGNSLFRIGFGYQLLTAAELDYEAATSHTVRVRSTDSGGASSERIFTIRVLDLPDGPPAEVTKCFDDSFFLINSPDVKVKINVSEHTLFLLGCKVEGTMEITVRGSDTQTVPFVGRVDDKNKLLSNSDDGFDLPDEIGEFKLNIGGLILSAKDVVIEYYQGRPQLRVQHPILTVPLEMGGGVGATITKPTIIDSTGIKFGTGQISLPTIDLRGYKLDLSGSINPVASGYEINATGDLTIPNIGKKKGSTNNKKGQECTLSASATIFVNTEGKTVLLLNSSNNPHDIYDLNSVTLSEIGVGLACSEGIPISNSGFSLTGVSGTVTFLPGYESFDLSVTITSDAEVPKLEQPVATAIGTLDVTINPEFQLDLIAQIYILSFETANAKVSFTESSFSATLNIQAVVVNGNVTVKAWSDRYGFHFTGSGTVKVGIEKHQFGEACVEYPCNPESCTWAFITYPCNWKTCRTCVGIPPVGFTGPKVGVEFGEFMRVGYGFKGYVNFQGITYGFFVDQNGKLSFGDVSQYLLASGDEIRAVQQQWLAAEAQGLSLDPRMLDSGQYHFLSNNKVVINTNMQTALGAADAITETRTVTRTASTAFIVSTDAPLDVTLVSPDGDVITPTSSSGVYESFYTEVTSYELARSLGNAPENQSYLRFAHVTADPDFVDDLDLLVDGTPVLLNLSLTAPTQREPLPIAAGTHEITISGAGGTVSMTLNVAEGETYTVVAAGDTTGTRLLSFTDDTSPPDASNQALIRFINLSQNNEEVGVNVNGGDYELLFVADQASTYLPVNAGSVEINVNDSDGFTFEDPPQFYPGNVYTVYIMDNTADWTGTGADVVCLQQLDESYVERTHIRYDVLQAEIGNWQIVVDGDLETTDYVVAVFGVGNPPQLEEVTVDAADPVQTTLNWSLTSEHTPTRVTVFANPEGISQTVVISDTAGNTITETLDTVYQGFELTQFEITAGELLSGAPDSYQLDLSHLPSGTYYLWMQVDDGRNITSQYAGSTAAPETPLPITISHADSFPTSWEPTLTISLDDEVDQLYVEWEALSHPDVDEYRLHVGPTAVSVTQSINAGGAILEYDGAGNPVGVPVGFTTLSNIEPNQPYYLSVEAVDVDSGLTVTSTPVLVEFSAGRFALTPTSGGASFNVMIDTVNTISLTLEVSEALFYPQVSLVVDESGLPSGLIAQFTAQETDGLTLLEAGETIGLEVYAAAAVAEGSYPLTVLAYNGLEVQRYTYELVVGEVTDCAGHCLYLPLVMQP